MMHTVDINELNMTLLSPARLQLELSVGYCNGGKTVALYENEAKYPVNAHEFLDIVSETFSEGLHYTYSQVMTTDGFIRYEFAVYSLLYATLIRAEYLCTFGDGWDDALAEFVVKCAQCVGAMLLLHSANMTVDQLKEICK